MPKNFSDYYNIPQEAVWCGSGDYPDCPHYFFAELILERYDAFIEGEEISMSFDFWEVPSSPTGVKGPTGDHVKFYESVDVTAFHPASANTPYDFERIAVTQECENADDLDTD